MISNEEGTFRAFGMMKIACTLQTRPQILQLLEIFNGRVLELTTEWVLVEMTGTPEQLEGLAASAAAIRNSRGGGDRTNRHSTQFAAQRRSAAANLGSGSRSA